MNTLKLLIALVILWKGCYLRSLQLHNIVKKDDIKININQDINKLYLQHLIVKRHAAPEPRPIPKPVPRPKGGGSSSGNALVQHHASLFIRKELKVDKTAVIFTIIALCTLFIVILILIFCYWRQRIV